MYLPPLSLVGKSIYSILADLKKVGLPTEQFMLMYLMPEQLVKQIFGTIHTIRNKISRSEQLNNNIKKIDTVKIIKY